MSLYYVWTGEPPEVWLCWVCRCGRLTAGPPVASSAEPVPAGAEGGGGDGPEVVEISSEEADRLLNGMRGLVNGVGGREESSVENYSESRDGVTRSLEKSKQTHISASEDDQNNVTAQREEVSPSVRPSADCHPDTSRPPHQLLAVLEVAQMAHIFQKCSVKRRH